MIVDFRDKKLKYAENMVHLGKFSATSDGHQQICCRCTLAVADTAKLLLQNSKA